MNKKTIAHGIVITALLITVFIAAALTPSKKYTDTAATNAPATVA